MGSNAVWNPERARGDTARHAAPRPLEQLRGRPRLPVGDRTDSPFIEVFTRTLKALMERDDLDDQDDQDEFTQLQLFTVVRAGNVDSWKAGLPVWLQRPVIALGAAIGRLRGFRPAGVAEPTRWVETSAPATTGATPTHPAHIPTTGRTCCPPCVGSRP